MRKIVILDNTCDLDSYRNNCGELAICIPEETEITLNIKREELTELEKIISDYANTFEINVSGIETFILNNVHFKRINNITTYRAYLSDEGINLINGFLYVDKTKERTDNAALSYSMQLIGTHQSWKDKLKNATLADLDLGVYTHNYANLLDLFQNNQVYQDGEETIYPLLGNFGAYIGEDQAVVEDIRFTVFRKALIDAMFCYAGYTVDSAFMNTDFFRREADYLLKPCFGIDESIDKGLDTKVTNSADLVIPSTFGSSSTVIVYDTDIVDTGNMYNNTNGLFETNRNVAELFVRWEGTIFVDPSVSPVFPYNVELFIGILENLTPPTIVSQILEVYQFTSVSDTVDFDILIPVSDLIAAQVASNPNGIFRDNYSLALNAVNFGTADAAVLQVGSTATFFTNNKHNFNNEDTIDIAKVLRTNFSLYDILLDYRRTYNLRFRTNEALRKVEIEPDPKKYTNYSTVDEAEKELKGFNGDPFDFDDIINLTPYVDACSFVEKDFSDREEREAFSFAFKSSTDPYSAYQEFADSDPIFSNDLTTNKSTKTTNINLSIFEPTLNDFDSIITSLVDNPVYIPYIRAEDNDDSGVPPKASSLVEPRALHVFGWAKQLTEDTPQIEVGFKFEGVIQDFVPNVGQVMPIELLFPSAISGVFAIENNVFRDNVTTGDLTNKNLVNTFYPDNLVDTVNLPNVQVSARITNLFFKCFDPRKVLRIYSEAPQLIRFNGNYKLVSLRFNIKTKRAVFVLKNIVYCNG